MTTEKIKTRENHIKFLLGSFLFDQIKNHPEKYHKVKADFLHYMINKSDSDKKIAGSYFENVENNEELKSAEKRFENEGGRILH
jgi:hypothetical protein